MKNLKDSILEKLKVDDIKLNIDFPIDNTLKDIAKFLKKQGFIGITGQDSNYALFNFQKNKCFTYNDTKSIWFADTSKEKISKENPIFFIECNQLFLSYKYDVGYLTNRGITFIVGNDKEKFLQELNKRFGWQ